MKSHFPQLLFSVVTVAWVVSLASGFLQNAAPVFASNKQQHASGPAETNQCLRSKQKVEATVDKTILLSDPLEDVESIRRYTESAIFNRGTDIGLQSLSHLSDLCNRRIPYDFGSLSAKGDHTVIERFEQLIPSKYTTSFLEQVRYMEENEWLSTNPDSVDGLPSFHLNLVSQGSPVFPTGTTKDPTEFQMGVQKLLEIVESCIYGTLLPEVQKLLNSTTIHISDIFVRKYGQDVCGSDFSRNGISAHYDVFSRVTAVVALDGVAADGRNGLFTTHISNEGITSNHAALRRFFPLDTGDGVVHTWDVLHGVDVEPGLDRTSLIVWFTEDSGNAAGIEDDSQAVSPWLSQHPDIDTDNVAQFVLASALSSIEDSARKDVTEMKEHKLYLKSASEGNTFALTRMGSLIEEGVLSSILEDEGLRVLDKLRPLATLPGPIRDLQSSGLGSNAAVVAMRFWFEGALRGNPLAQKALADELMFQASHSEYSEDSYLLAAILFALAAQQGDDEASDSLSRVIDFFLQHRNVESKEDFLASPIVKVARAAS